MPADVGCQRAFVMHEVGEILKGLIGVEHGNMGSGRFARHRGRILAIFMLSLLICLLATVPAFADDSTDGMTDASASVSSADSAASSEPGADGEVGSTSLDDDVIRIGLSEYPRYGYYDKDGNPTGCDVEFAYKIAEYANIHVKIVLIPDAETYFASLDDGSVDILFDAIKTDERERKYLYADNESGNTSNSVYVRSDDDRFQYGNIEQLKDMVIGSETGSAVTGIFCNWCAGYGFTPDIREYSDAAAIDAALDAGEIDAGIYGTDSVEGYRTVLTFSPTPYYCIFRSDDMALKAKVDEAMTRILTEDPLYKEKLVQKYTGSTTYEIDAFTQEEKDYISTHNVVTVAVLSDDEPYYSQSADGRSEGVIPDYYARISKLTGLQFSFMVYDTNDEAKAAVLDGRADMLAMYSDGLVSAYRDDLRLTNMYATVNAVEVTHTGTDPADIHTVAAKHRTLDAIQSAMGDDSIVYAPYDNAKDCFTALKDHDVDAMVCGLPSATWLINQTDSAAYSITPLSSLSIDLCGAMAYDQDTLCSIMNKAIAASTYSFNGIVTNNTLPEDNWRSALARIPTVWTVVFSLVMMALVLGLVIVLAALIRRQKEAAAVAAAKADNERREAQIAAREESDEERNRFFSNISHDMRTPLNAIIGFSGLAQEKAESVEVRDYLSKVQTSGNLLLDLIDDTLTVSKMNSGKLQLDLRPVDTAELARSIIIPIREAAARKGVTFTVEDDVGSTVVLMDRLSVQKILLNLLSNAVKYTPEGGWVRFTVSPDPKRTDPGLSIVAKIEDSGIGISEDFLPDIYEPFIQENRMGESVGGTGLGLSIVHRLVEMMGGTIEVQSVVGSGTAFTVRLHFDLDEVEGLGSAQAEAQTDLSATGLGLEGRKVLLCEDNELNAEIARTLLEHKGMEVTVAQNGAEGLAAFERSAEGGFDVILMDLRMPVMGGLETARAIRATSRRDALQIPIIAMTADAFEDDVRNCLEAGMDGHIAKPIDKELLYRTLEEYLG